MKKAKFIPIILAGALLASCGETTPDISSPAPSSEQPASSVPTGEATSSEITTPASSEQTPVSSEVTTPSSSEVTTPSSSEEPVTPPASSSEEPVPSVITSWEQITAGAKGQLNLFFSKIDENNNAHKPDDFLPTLPVAPSIEWTYDSSLNPKDGGTVGVAALTGDDSNENKALIGQYNQMLVAKGWTKATDDEIESAPNELYGTNAYIISDTDSSTRLLVEIIPCADAQGDGFMTFAPVDPDGEDITSGVFISVQTI